MSEPFSSLSHLLTAPVALILGIWSIRRSRGHPVRRAALGLFTAAVVLLMVVSGLYHWLPWGSSERELFRRLDHSAIFAMIACSATAIHLLAFRGAWRWTVPAVIWAGALFGMVFKVLFYYSFAESTWLLLYLALGWLGLLSVFALARNGHWRIVALVLLGGLVYTAGALFDYWRAILSMPRALGAHDVFHVAVIGGIAVHWRVIWTLGERLPPARLADL